MLVPKTSISKISWSECTSAVTAGHSKKNSKKISESPDVSFALPYLECSVALLQDGENTDCNKRWCYVRDYYIRRKGKPGTGSSGEAAKKRSDLLSFLDSILSQRNSITNVIENPGENNQHSSEQTPFQNQEPEDMTFNKEKDIATDTNYNNDNSKGNGNNDEDINKKFKEDGNIKSNLKRKNNSHAQERLNLLKQIVNRKPSPQNDLDETDLFFSSMAKIVKKLPRYEQAQLRMQIGSLVGNAELRYISIDSDQMNSPKPSTSGSDYSESPMRSSAFSTSTVTDYAELAIPIPRTNTASSLVPSRPVPTITLNEQGQIYFIPQDNIQLQ